MVKAKESYIKDANYLKEVRNQYENYPYPPRNPEDEKNNFLYAASAALDCLNYYHYSGTRDFTKDFNVLVAGGGTGDATIMLAEQLKDTHSEVVHLDISEASIEMAKARANIRGLDNITWVHGSILNVKNILNRKFDYINCIGVLHHLESPEQGLAAITSVLKDEGVLDIMLYGKYGRESIYHIQNLMKILNKNEHNIQKKVDNCKSVLQHLPATSYFHAIKNIFPDFISYGDTGIYDLFLHSNDVAYSVPDVYNFLSSSNLKLSHFFSDKVYGIGNNLYNLESYFADGSLSDVISDLSLQEKHAAAELMHGKIFKHHFYATKIDVTIPSIDNLDNIPALSTIFKNNVYQEIRNVCKCFQVGQTIDCNAHNVEIKFSKTPNVDRIFSYLDGNTSIKDIFMKVRASYSRNEKKPTIDELRSEFRAIFSAFNLHDWMFLRDKSVQRFKNIEGMQEKFLLNNANV